MDDRKEIGAHYTPKILAEFVAEQVLKARPPECKPHKIHVLDPAVGDGELLNAILKELSNQDCFNIEVFGFDTNQQAISSAITRIKNVFPKISMSLMNDDFLDFALKNHDPNGQLSLFGPTSSLQFDLVIANPPYVRTQIIGAKKSQVLARQFGLSGRVDLYYAFLQGIARVLRPGGIAGIIVSNRFLTTKSGASVRKGILEKFDILHIWDLGDTRLFEAAVLPAVLLLKRKNGQPHDSEPKFTSIYLTSDKTPTQYSLNVITALNESGVVEVSNGECYLVQHGRLDHGKSSQGIWRVATKASDSWLSIVDSHTFCTFGDIGKIRVGIKTTADKIFIRSDWDDLPEEERPELLKLLTTHHIARRFKAIEPERQKKVLYTHKVVQGRRIAVNLNEFPKAAKYLNHYRSMLEKREYVLKAGRNWYEIWVPHNPDTWEQPKLVFRDITEKPTFWIDLSGSVVNGDCYWLACEKPQQMDLLWLALAIGNSSFIETFYDRRFNNKLYAGRRRFMTQYVEKFPLPNPETHTSKCIIRVTKELFASISSPATAYLEKELDRLVKQAFGLSVEKIAR